MSIKVGDTIYHASRYWKMDNLRADEEIGWNANYLRYTVTRITDARIYATGTGPDGQPSNVQFPRAPKRQSGYVKPTTLEADGEQYHSRFHEYFYTKIPTKRARMPVQAVASGVVLAYSVLGISPPYSAGESPAP